MTPIRHSKPEIPGDDPRWSVEESSFVVVACMKCKRLFSCGIDSLKSASSKDGLSPFDPGAPMHVFGMTLRCAKEGCESHLPVKVVRNVDTSAAALLAEAEKEWQWEGLTCLAGHAIPDRKRLQ